VGDLGGRFARVRVAVERQEPVAAERLDHHVHRLRVGERRELRTPDAKPRVFHSLAERDEPQEELPTRLARLFAHRLEELLGASREGAGDPADPTVSIERQRSTLRSLRQLRERVLQ
jgi:hypothetical protein